MLFHVVLVTFGEGAFRDGVHLVVFFLFLSYVVFLQRTILLEVVFRLVALRACYMVKVSAIALQVGFTRVRGRLLYGRVSRIKCHFASLVSFGGHRERVLGGVINNFLRRVKVP